jgi:hypothetical protein
MSPVQIVAADRWDYIDEFYSFFMQVFGAWLDLDVVLKQSRSHFEAIRAQSKAKLNMTDEDLDKLPCIYGEGDPNTTTNPPLFLSSQGAFRQRISPGGPDSIICGQMCIVIIYQVWEEHFRGVIAARMGVKSEELTFDVMGDIRSLRQSIVHHSGRAIQAIEWLNIVENDTINMDIERWKSIKERLRSMCRDLKKRMYGSEEDPRERFL